MKSLLFILLSISLVHASVEQAPPSFSYSEGKAVFIDIQNADYSITYDVNAETVEVESIINFHAPENGFPIFDLVAEPTLVTINGESASTETIKDPDQQTTLRILKENLGAGNHQLIIKHQISTNVVFRDGGLASGFWMSDLNDRRYLEQYLPTNLEFDQYKMVMKVEILGAEGIPHVLKANGKVYQTTENNFEVEFPDFYSASSVFFHLFPANNFTNNVQFYYQSIDGRLIPVDIYTSYDVEAFVVDTKRILAELESDYGPFPHQQLIIYGNAPSGGMEYSGATATSLRALGHELFHSYHARGLMPANGNAGWMDEAIARWRDNNYPLTRKLSFESTMLAGHSLWARMTDRMAYTEGSAFLSWVAFRMDEKNLNFKTFLREYFEKFKHTTVTTQLFQAELTEASGLELEEDFNRYIYGKYSNPSLKNFSSKVVQEDPNHPVLSREELLKLTWGK